jgi:hypothetical protein
VANPPLLQARGDQLEAPLKISLIMPWILRDYGTSSVDSVLNGCSSTRLAGTGGLDMLLDRPDKLLKDRVLNRHKDPDGVLPPTIFDAKNVMLIISCPSSRRADRGG